MKKSTLLFAFLLSLIYSLQSEAQIFNSSLDTLWRFKDNTLYQDPEGLISNGLGDYFFAGMNNNGAVRRAVTAFDVAGNIPAGSVIVSAKLVLFKSKGGSGSDVINVHRLAKNWGEGTSNASGEEGQGAPATAGDATWTCVNSNGAGSCNASWTNPGGDFAGTVSTSTTVTTNGQYVFPSTSQMVTDVQNMLDFPANDFGWLIKHADPTPSSAVRFNSKDNPDPNTHPMLIVEYVGCINGNPVNKIVDIEGNAEVHGSLQVEDVIKLAPRACEPDTPVEGMIYYDLNLKKLRVYDGSVWQDCW